MIQKKRNLYATVKKLTEGTREDALVAREFLLENIMNFTPKQWSDLRYQYFMNEGITGTEDLSGAYIQKYLYDKRQEEIRANKRKYTRKNKLF